MNKTELLELIHSAQQRSNTLKTRARNIIKEAGKLERIPEEMQDVVKAIEKIPNSLDNKYNKSLGRLVDHIHAINEELDPEKADIIAKEIEVMNSRLFELEKTCKKFESISPMTAEQLAAQHLAKKDSFENTKNKLMEKIERRGIDTNWEELNKKRYTVDKKFYGLFEDLRAVEKHSKSALEEMQSSPDVTKKKTSFANQLGRIFTKAKPDSKDLKQQPLPYDDLHGVVEVAKMQHTILEEKTFSRFRELKSIDFNYDNIIERRDLDIDKLKINISIGESLEGNLSPELTEKIKKLHEITGKLSSYPNNSEEYINVKDNNFEKMKQTTYEITEQLNDLNQLYQEIQNDIQQELASFSETYGANQQTLTQLLSKIKEPKEDRASFFKRIEEFKGGMNNNLTDLKLYQQQIPKMNSLISEMTQFIAQTKKELDQVAEENRSKLKPKINELQQNINTNKPVLNLSERDLLGTIVKNFDKYPQKELRTKTDLEAEYNNQLSAISTFRKLLLAHKDAKHKLDELIKSPKHPHQEPTPDEKQLMTRYLSEDKLTGLTKQFPDMDAANLSTIKDLILINHEMSVTHHDLLEKIELFILCKEHDIHTEKFPQLFANEQLIKATINMIKNPSQGNQTSNKDLKTKLKLFVETIKSLNTLRPDLQLSQSTLNGLIREPERCQLINEINKNAKQRHAIDIDECLNASYESIVAFQALKRNDRIVQYNPLIFELLQKPENILFAQCCTPPAIETNHPFLMSMLDELNEQADIVSAQNCLDTNQNTLKQLTDNREMAESTKKIVTHLNREILHILQDMQTEKDMPTRKLCKEAIRNFCKEALPEILEPESNRPGMSNHDMLVEKVNALEKLTTKHFAPTPTSPLKNIGNRILQILTLGLSTLFSSNASKKTALEHSAKSKIHEKINEATSSIKDRLNDMKKLDSTHEKALNAAHEEKPKLKG